MREQIRTQIDVIARERGLDVVEEIAYAGGETLYQLRRSGIPRGSKIGLPLLYVAGDDGKPRELDTDEIFCYLAWSKEHCPLR